jgi:enoyl-CoA hydratase/carnithine racemase
MADTGGLVPSFEDYQHKFPMIRLTRDDGILLVQLHTDGGELIMGGQAHMNFLAMVSDVARDPENKVIILTGTGENFTHKTDYDDILLTPLRWAQSHVNTRRIIMTLLDIEAPIIAAINGPSTIHSEWALLSDIVLAADHAYFQDLAHLTSDKHGLAPGDGVHVVWPLLLGPTRGRYFLLTGQKLSAHEAMNLGVVNEVMPQAELLDRAWELARQLRKVPPLSMRFTRSLTLQDLRRRMLNDLGYGLALEGLDSAYQWMQAYAAPALVEHGGELPPPDPNPRAAPDAPAEEGQ